MNRASKGDHEIPVAQKELQIIYNKNALFLPLQKTTESNNYRRVTNVSLATLSDVWLFEIFDLFNFVQLFLGHADRLGYKKYQNEKRKVIFNREQIKTSRLKC